MGVSTLVLEKIVPLNFTLANEKRSSDYDRSEVFKYSVAVLCNLRPLCYYSHWLMGCCGVDTLHGFGLYPDKFWDSKANIDELIPFLKGVNTSTGYRAYECLFTLSDSQKNKLEQLVTHPSCKFLDSWDNRAHGPETLNLYRLSL